MKMKEKVKKNLTKESATGTLIINPAKARFGSISLDIKNAKQYNNPDNKRYDSHFLSLLSGVKIKPQGSSLWRTPTAIIPNSFQKTKAQSPKAKVILCSLLCALVINEALANPLEPKNFIAPSTRELNTNNNQNLEDLRANEFYLNLNQKEIEAVQKKDDEIREAFDRFSQKEINYKPVIRPIASMDTISLHPYFTFSLLLPAGSIINHIDSSTPMAVLKFENNALLVRPNADFKIANLTILYKLNEKNHILNILAHFYEKNEELDKLNLVYAYVEDKKLDGLEVINAYIKENGSLPKQKYSYIQINDVSYRIVEDDKYGSIFIKGKKYRVDNNTIYK